MPHAGQKSNEPILWADTLVGAIESEYTVDLGAKWGELVGVVGERSLRSGGGMWGCDTGGA